MADSGRSASKSLPDAKFQVCIIGDGLKDNQQLIKSIEKFNLPIVFSTDGIEFINKGTEFTIYILEEFEGETYTALRKAGQKMLGPTTVIHYAEKEQGLPNTIRPLYTISMKNLVISFSGFRVKQDLLALVGLIHHMGGSIRKDFHVSKTTHLVATPNSTNGEKYRSAVNLSVPIMTSQWIYEVWARRHDASCKATDQEFLQYKLLLPFVGCKMAFIGYQSSEEQHMFDMSLKNAGEIVQACDPSCTHIVVKDGYTFNSKGYAQSVCIVNDKWFWACIQMDGKAEEKFYEFENPSVVTSPFVTVPVKVNKQKRDWSIGQQFENPSAVTSPFVIVPVKVNKQKRRWSVTQQFAMGKLQEVNYSGVNLDFKKRSDNPSFPKSPLMRTHTYPGSKCAVSRFRQTAISWHSSHHNDTI